MLTAMKMNSFAGQHLQSSEDVRVKNGLMMGGGEAM